MKEFLDWWNQSFDEGVLNTPTRVLKSLSDVALDEIPHAWEPWLIKWRRMSKPARVRFAQGWLNAKKPPKKKRKNVSDRIEEARIEERERCLRLILKKLVPSNLLSHATTVEMASAWREYLETEFDERDTYVGKDNVLRWRATGEKVYQKSC